MFEKIKRSFLTHKFFYYGMLYNIYSRQFDTYIELRDYGRCNRLLEKLKNCVNKRQIILDKLRAGLNIKTTEPVKEDEDLT